MKHAIHESNFSDGESGCGSIIFFLIMISIIGVLLNVYTYKSTEQLQTILKNECGMEYSIDEIRRNGDNLSRICGLKNETN